MSKKRILSNGYSPHWRDDAPIPVETEESKMHKKFLSEIEEGPIIICGGQWYEDYYKALDDYLKRYTKRMFTYER